MTRRMVLVATVLGVALAGGAFVVIRTIRHGFSAREEPTAVEAFLARRVRHLSIPNGARERPNPVALTTEVLARGRAHFADHCAACHGNDGKGQTEIGRKLYPRAPDMTAAGTQTLSDGELFYIIKNGVRLTGMPAWGEDTPEDDEFSWHLVHFIRHLPGITPDELQQMDKLNPKSPSDLAEEESERRFLQGDDLPKSPKHHH